MYRRAFSDVIQDVQSSRKEEARRAEFVRVGQVSLDHIIALEEKIDIIHDFTTRTHLQFD